MWKCSSPILTPIPNLFNLVTKNDFQLMKTSGFYLKWCKKRDNKNLYIYFRKSLCWKRFLEIFFLGFILFPHFNNLCCCFNEYPVKERISLYLKLPLNLNFICDSFYFWKNNYFLILNKFISEYLDQIPPWKEMKEVFSIKLQTENLCF